MLEGQRPCVVYLYLWCYTVRFFWLLRRTLLILASPSVPLSLIKYLGRTMADKDRPHGADSKAATATTATRRPGLLISATLSR